MKTSPPLEIVCCDAAPQSGGGAATVLEPARVMKVPSMCCSHEERPIRGALACIAGVSALEVNLQQRTLTFRASESTFGEALVAVNGLGFGTVPALPTDAEDACCASGARSVGVALFRPHCAATASKNAIRTSASTSARRN